MSEERVYFVPEGTISEKDLIALKAQATVVEFVGPTPPKVVSEVLAWNAALDHVLAEAEKQEMGAKAGIPDLPHPMIEVKDLKKIIESARKE